MNTAALFVVDELEAAAGCAARLRAAYLDGYAPAARERGMILRHAWRTPPVDLREGIVTLTFIWSVDGPAGWWRARLGAASDPAVRAWWEQARPLIAAHRRSYHEDIAPDA